MRHWLRSNLDFSLWARIADEMTVKHVSIVLSCLVFFALSLDAHAGRSKPRTNCATGFSELRQIDPSIEALYDAINSQPPGGIYEHSMSTRKGMGYVRIGEITAEHPEFLTALADAVSKGKIAEIHVGNIVGPKVLNWIVRHMDAVPEGHVMRMTGYFTVSDLVEAKALQIANTEKLIAAGKAHLNLPGYSWSQANLQQFGEAIERLDLKKVCLKIWKTNDLAKCGKLHFDLQSNALQDGEWTKN